MQLAEALRVLPGPTDVLHRLPEGRTNAVWRVRWRGCDAVLRLRRGPRGTRLETHDEVRLLRSLGPLVPEILAWDDGMLLTRYVPSIVLPPPERLGRTLAALHRRDLPWLRRLTLGPLLRSLRWPTDAERREVEAVARALTDAPPALCHHDLRPANLRWTGDRIVFIDWEYAAMADPAFDLVEARRTFGADYAVPLMEAYRRAGGPGVPTEAMERAAELLERHWYGLHRPETTKPPADTGGS